MISAADYKTIIQDMYGSAPKTTICRYLRISRPTHDKWLQQGIKTPADVSNFQNIVSVNINLMRARARKLDKWTFSGRLIETKRLTFVPKPIRDSDLAPYFT